MTGDAATARLHTTHPRPAVVAAALAPDNTPEIDTQVQGGHVETTVSREDVAGLRATVQDYLRNLDAADRTVRAVLAVEGADTERTREYSESQTQRANTDSPTNEDTKPTDNE